ncbi:MAG: TonB-dependent receptor [Bacteroidetes bacterium]|nr:TonB-dependent receptor [Bacteroidota bacterium]
MRLTFSLLILSFLMLSFALQAQQATGTIRGFIYEEETGEPVIFTNVYLVKTTYGSTTDLNGYFVISKVPPGSYTLRITYLGYDTLNLPIVIKSDDLLSHKFYLKKSAINLEEVSISAERQDRKIETQTSLIKVTPKEIKQIPMVGGQADLAQYLQVLPGVIFTGDQGGQLYIRGGSPIQNKVLLDGMTIYNPFHSIGFFSVFDMDIMRNADVYTGGFNAEYGDRISSIMDIKTIDGNKKRFSGKADVSTFGAKLLLQGPIVKEKEDSRGSASFILSYKNSYLKESSKIFYQYIDKQGLPFSFSDIYGKFSINAANGSKVNLFGFNFNDHVNYREIQDFKWNSSGGGLNFIVIPPKSSVLINGICTYSYYKITLDEVSRSQRSSSIGGFNIGLNFTYFFGRDELKYGLEMFGFKTIFDFYNSLNRKIDYTQNTTELAGFLNYKWKPGRLLVEPGVRVQWYASLAEVVLEPRLAMKYNLSETVRVKLAGGFYSQNFISATYPRDVVNLFYGFLSGPDNLQDQFEGKEVTSKLQKSRHLILGIEWEPVHHLLLNLEGYYKYYPQLTNLNFHKIYDDSPEYSNEPDILKKDFIIEKGNARGADLSIKYEQGRVACWAVYSLSYVNMYDGFQWYVPHYDRRHNLNLMFSYTAGKKRNWIFDVRWNYGSGFPFTQTQGYFEKINFSNGINSNYTTSNGELGILYADYNEGRLPSYHRLDLSIKKIWNLGRFSKLEADLSVTNVYDRSNIFYFDRVTYKRVNQLPIMPSAGLSFNF